jgi:hypothetical protein
MTAIEMLRVASMLIKMGNNAKLNWQKYQAVKAKAEAEGREINDEEITEAIDAMDTALDNLRDSLSE